MCKWTTDLLRYLQPSLRESALPDGVLRLSPPSVSAVDSTVGSGSSAGLMRA